MTKRELRFGVSDGAGLRAATWKLAVGKKEDDVYLACRPLQSAVKVSLHASGDWRFAYTDREVHAKLVAGLPGDKGRVIQGWKRPAEHAPGCTAAFRIVTPASAVNSAINPSTDKSVVWIGKPPADKATQIDVIVTAPGTRVRAWPGSAHGTRLIGALALPSGSTVWAVAWEIPLPRFQDLGRMPFGRFFKGRSRRDLRRGQSLRMLAFGEEPDGSRVFFDLAGVYNPTRRKLARLFLRDAWRAIRQRFL